jgi:tellurite resistance protein TehA-like permease
MGTGIVAILFHLIPFGHPVLHYISIVFFLINVLLFTIVLSMSILRYVLYPEIWSVMIQDPVNSLFLATCPMGFATLIEMWVFVCVPLWGDWAKTFAWALWMVDAVAAASVTVSLSFILSHRWNASPLSSCCRWPQRLSLPELAQKSQISSPIRRMRWERSSLPMSCGAWRRPSRW